MLPQVFRGIISFMADFESRASCKNMCGLGYGKALYRAPEFVNFWQNGNEPCNNTYGGIFWTSNLEHLGKVPHICSSFRTHWKHPFLPFILQAQAPE